MLGGTRALLQGWSEDALRHARVAQSMVGGCFEARARTSWIPAPWIEAPRRASGDGRSLIWAILLGVAGERGCRGARAAGGSAESTPDLRTNERAVRTRELA